MSDERSTTVDHRLDPWHCTLDDFRSSDPAMQRCLEIARAAAHTDLPTLILGESGTGKTLLARAIHNSGKRGGNTFVSFNAAALSDTLLDSQLFGHEQGAFTGAQKAVKGKFELAHGGTLFIDEIADLTLPAQAKILRAIEYGEFERLGSEKLHVADVRLISATHLPIATFIETGRFRKDLFYRICGITVTLPPLRDRPADLRALIGAEIAFAAREQRRSIVGLTTEAADVLLTHDWPGNLRELNRVIHVAVALTSADVIPADAVILETFEKARATATVAPVPSKALDSDLNLRTAEQRHIQMVLQKMGGNKRRAARALGLSRSTLDRKLSA